MSRKSWRKMKRGAEQGPSKEEKIRMDKFLNIVSGAPRC